MDVGQLFARLHGKTVNYTGVGGGVAELTPDEIAGALAFVPKGLGRAVLEAVYWPEAARRSTDLAIMVLNEVTTEIFRQGQRLSNADIDLQIAKAASEWTRASPTSTQRRAILKAQMRLDSLRIELWPKNTLAHTAAITWAIVSELSGLMKCKVCNGRGTVVVDSKETTCRMCDGSGQYKKNDYQRALSIHCDPKGYERRWKRVYEWLFHRMSESLMEAKIVFKRSIESRIED